jgi:hypothetical protein
MTPLWKSPSEDGSEGRFLGGTLLCWIRLVSEPPRIDPLGIGAVFQAECVL